MKEREHPLKSREHQVTQVPGHAEVHTQKERDQYKAQIESPSVNYVPGKSNLHTQMGTSQ
jgi:hypothetical protein